jgi:hypothetical protein
MLGKLRPGRPSPAMVVACIGLIVALTGTAWAALGKNSVGSKQLKKGAVKTADLGGAAVTSAKLGDGAVTSAKLGSAAVTAAKLGTVVTRFSAPTPLPDNGTLQSAHAQCASGEKLIGGGANFDPIAGADTPLIASRPSADTSGGAPTNGGTFPVWRATAINAAGGTGATNVVAWAVCVQ